MEEMRYLCRSALEDGRPADWYLLVREVPAGRFACEQYGLRMEIPGGPAAAVHGITCGREEIENLQEELAARQVPPERLAAAVAAWHAQESSSWATLSAVCSTAAKST